MKKTEFLNISAMGKQHWQLPALRKRKLCLQSLFVTVVILMVYWMFRSSYFQSSFVQHLFQTQTTTPSTPQTEHAFIEVKNTKTLLASAYLEHRMDTKQVRVIAVVLRKETVAYRCILHCQKQRHTSDGVTEIHRDHFGFPYGTADIMCPLPSGCDKPAYIAVATKDSKPEEPAHEMLEVKNHKAQTESFLYNFTVCISVMFDFTNVLQLVQSLEMLWLLGVNKVFIYITSCSPETQRVLDYYSEKGLVEVIPWSISRYLNVSRGWQPEHDPGDLHYYGQIPALNDCLYRNMYKAKYVALHDVDELILPQTVKSWTELLPQLEKNYGHDKCFMFENNVFPTNVSLPLPKTQHLAEQDHWKGVPGVNILAHLHHEPVPKKGYLENFKIIVNPRAFHSVTVHGVLEPDQICSPVDRSMARMYHTRAQVQTQLTPDKLIYDDRLLSYSAPPQFGGRHYTQKQRTSSHSSKDLNKVFD